MENFLWSLIGVILTAILTAIPLLLKHYLKGYIDRELVKGQIQFQSKLSELSFYKRHYYEKEFEVYKEITRATLKCSQHASNLFTIVEYSSNDIDKEKERLEKLSSEARNALNNLTDVIFENYPFYPVEIFEQVSKFKKICHETYTHFQVYKLDPLYDDELRGPLPEKVWEFNEKIQNLREVVLKLIRDNVDNYRKKERDF